jgi:hypothetical protein
MIDTLITCSRHRTNLLSDNGRTIGRDSIHKYTDMSAHADR